MGCGGMGQPGRGRVMECLREVRIGGCPSQCLSYEVELE